MFWILMTSLTDKPLISQWEVWLRSLLGLKELTIEPQKKVYFVAAISFFFDWSIYSSENIEILAVIIMG